MKLCATIAKLAKAVAPYASEPVTRHRDYPHLPKDDSVAVSDYILSFRAEPSPVQVNTVSCRPARLFLKNAASVGQDLLLSAGCVAVKRQRMGRKIGSVRIAKQGFGDETMNLTA